jgi:hypothetical protein
MDKPTVFISFSHQDAAWEERLRPHLGVLERLGHLSIWDDRRIDAGAEWYAEIMGVMERAAVAQTGYHRRDAEVAELEAKLGATADG